MFLCLPSIVSNFYSAVLFYASVAALPTMLYKVKRDKPTLAPHPTQAFSLSCSSQNGATLVQQNIQLAL